MGGWVGEGLPLEGFLCFQHGVKHQAILLLPGLGLDGDTILDFWRGGWVGGWVDWVEEIEAVGMRYCLLGVGGWVGR